MKFSRAVRAIAGLALVLPVLVLSEPAAASRGVPTADRVFVTDLFAGTVSVIDAGSNTAIATIAVGGALLEATASPDASEVYVSSADLGVVSVIDPATNTVVDTIPVGGSPSAIAFTPDSAKAYVIDNGSDTVSVIDTATARSSARSPFPRGREPPRSRSALTAAGCS
jgi:YVTN family beta-propeller protein